ncbi:BON domain-containing protein [Caldimonas brevitalea]|uniref:Transporter n=1 Tax=Caldimonas brevitalea TaxID=413882 RepID=A0A0G3BM73_9BURK|nr:BON domain-containing protein [Caldimonas brevitalea]AKJ30539.1 transporter [Caldimonas brevitalea]
MKKLVLAAMMAATGILATTGCAVSDGQTSVGQYVDDATIATRVKTRFAQDDTVSAMRIEVEALQGTVQLSGFATSEAEKSRAAELARSVADVKSVRNDIIVRAPAK